MLGDTWECQGRDEHGQFGSGTFGFYSPNNVDELASIIETEAGGQKVRDVWSAYAHFVPGAKQSRTIARQVLAEDLKDNTRGATHFYSPGHMPLEGERTNGKDIGGGLESVPGVVGADKQPARNYRPVFADKYIPIEVPGVPPATFKFYRQPGEGPVDHYSRPVHDPRPRGQPAR